MTAGNRLEAFVHVDMVDSTGLLVSRGVASQIGARDRLGDVVAAAAADTDVRIIEVNGDGTLLASPSVVSSLAFASRVQSRVEAESFEVRIGVAVGEDAARHDAVTVEAHCPPGRIAIDPIGRRCASGAIPGLVFETIAIDARGEPSVITNPHDDVGALLAGARTGALSVVMFSDANDPNGAALSEDVLAESPGVVIDSNHNGHVAVFDNVGDALGAAAQLHGVAAAASLHVDADAPLGFRIGVAIGELVTTDSGAFGRVMVEAARLQSAADDGMTVITSDVHTLAGPDVADSVGEFVLKGIEQPVGVARVHASGVAALLPLPPALSRAQRFAFAGRTTHLGGLRTLWAEALTGDVRASVLIGEEGSGKTRLATEFASELHAAGAVVLVGRCSEQLARPYESIVDALAPLAAIDPTVAEALETGTGPLGPLFGRPSGGEATDVNVDRFTLFAAVTDVFVRVGRVRPIVLLIDDAQWATPDSLLLLETIVSSAPPCRTMIVATCRDEQLDQAHPVQRLLKAHRPGHRVDRRRLDRLDVTDISDMLASRTGAPLQGIEIEFAHKVASISGGSPLYAEELIVHFATTGELHHSADGWELRTAPDDLNIPESVTALMATRVARLAPDVIELLTIAAVMGATFDLEVLSRVANRSDDDVLDAVEAAATARLIFEKQPGEPCVFSDELVREALLEQLGASRRARIHQQIAEVLSEHRPHEIDQLAIHWDASPGNDAKLSAADALRRVADRDIAAGSWESAVSRLQRAIELHAAIGSADQAMLGELRYSLGAALRTLGDGGYRPALVTAGQIARQLRDGDLLGRCAVAMMRPGSWFPEANVIDDEIVEMCEDALLLLDQDSPMRVRVLAALATNLAYHPDVERRRALLREAQDLARADGDLTLIGTTLVAEVITEREPHTLGRRAEIAGELRQIGRLVDDRNIAFVGGIFTLLEMYGTGRLDQAAALLDELEAAAETSRTYWHCFLVSHFRTATAILRCEPDALAMAAADRTRFEGHDVDWFGVWVIQTASVALTNGTLADMLMPLAEATDSWSGDSWALKWNYAIAKAHMEAGRFDEAVAAIEANWDPDYDDYWLVSVQNLGLLGLELDRADWCQMTLDRLLPYRGRLAIIGICVSIGAQISTALGQAALGLGQVEFAEELFREAVDQAESVRAPFFATNSRRFLARTLLHRDPGSIEARQLIETNVSNARRFGFALEEAEAVSMLDAFSATS